jgi:putative ABC transport system permease protein
VIFGVVPAFRGTKSDISTAFRESGAADTGLSRIGRAGAHQLLVVGRITLAIILLAGAGLMLRSLRHQLFGVSTTDPLTFGAVALLVLLATLSATCLPARRATRVAPQRALRGE